MADPAPTVIVLAGPNGAGKTTASRTLLADTLNVMTFVNADVIAQGLAGFDPDSAALEASRIMLERLYALAEKQADFAFETTLAARSYAPWLDELRQAGYADELAEEVANFFRACDAARFAAGQAPAAAKLPTTAENLILALESEP